MTRKKTKAVPATIPAGVPIPMDRAIHALLDGTSLEFQYGNGPWRSIVCKSGELYTAGLPTPSTLEDPRWKKEELPFTMLASSAWRLPSVLMIEHLQFCRGTAESASALNRDQLVSLHHVDPKELLHVLYEGVDTKQQQVGKILFYLSTKQLRFKTGPSNEAD